MFKLSKNPTEFINNYINSVVSVSIIIDICLATRLHHNYRQLPSEWKISEKERRNREKLGGEIGKR